MTRLLSRSAENLFWLARYIERAENLARILDVQETFARDSGGRQDWRMVLVINADAEAFYKLHTEAVSANVLRFYITERTNPTSIFASVHAARENARALRPLISTEMWRQLNMLYNRLLALKPADVAEEKLSEAEPGSCSSWAMKFRNFASSRRVVWSAHSMAAPSW